MLAIKLKMAGRRNQRTFRVIVQEARSKLGGKSVEDIGWYNPHTNQVSINKERAQYWLGVGAQPTERAAQILKKATESGVQTYETRVGRKKNKGPKGDAEASSTEAPPVEGETAEATDGQPAGEEAPPEVPAEEEKPAVDPQPQAEEAPVEEEQKEEAAEESKQETPADEKKDDEEQKENVGDSPEEKSEEVPKEETPVEEKKEEE